MDFVTSVKTCLAEKYAEFNGRASRSEFWWFALFCFLVNLLGGAVFRGWISSLISLALLVPSIGVAARRLHDIGKSGWWQLLAFIPLIGWLVLLYWYVQPTHAGSNPYGDEPKDAAPPEVAPGPQ